MVPLPPLATPMGTLILLQNVLLITTWQRTSVEQKQISYILAYLKLQPERRTGNDSLGGFTQNPGYGLRSGLWPTAVFTQAPLAVSG